MLEKVEIGNLSISPATFLAPIAEITDITFRKVVKKFGGTGAVFTEMISSEAYTRDNEKTKFLVNHSKEESPLFFQIMGTDPERMALSAKMLQDEGADAIDVNMGCPANNVTKNGSGSALLKDLVLAKKIIQQVRKAVNIPFTIKIRSGWNDNSLVYREIGKTAQEEGVNAVFFHGRTKKQMFGDVVRYEHIKELKSLLKIPVIGNGDIRDRETLDKMLKTKCDGIMIARAAIKKPWIFQELLSGKEVDEVVLHSVIFDQFKEVKAIYPENLAVHKMRCFLGWYSKSLKKGKQLRIHLNELKSTDDVEKLLRNHFHC
jgi:nifR3 family TIM-barrel protein